MNKKDDCIFCKIISNEAPADKVYEDENFVAFMNLRPSSKGAVLVVHKDHTDDLQSTPDEMLSQFLPASKKVAEAVMKATGATGFNLTINNGKTAGQVIFHLHVHIIPRYSDDGLKLFPEHDSEFNTRKSLADQISKNIS
jgi:histidine triad (HIT) family protein